ncbi:hypothetical protein CL684_00200 [Candidatus Campbellbacteria bacterium]|nr:hypothetical protein [Candidatus Campbellbacteria bacterium]|tara:strand:+ start:564 stop:1253 length:690 start_codon:yes stop_codon:yes gene_type:complete
MKTSLRKRTIVIPLVGLIFMVIPIFTVVPQITAVMQGEQVTGTVVEIIEKRDSDGDTIYKPVFNYEYQGQTKSYTPSYSGSRNLIPSQGEQVTLYIDGTRVTQGVWNIGFIAPLVFGLIGLLLVIYGIRSYIKDVKRHNLQDKLKRYGNRIQAYYVSSKKSNHAINKQYGTILFVQEENGERVFQSHPIFADFSTRFLESHNFDVYVDPTDASQYYVDVEKFFGNTVTF